VESLEGASPDLASVAVAGSSAADSAGASGPIEIGASSGGDFASEFGESVVNPPVEEQLVDAAFEGDDDDLDIPDFLK
ncbi:cell division protein FtsZ, partial [Leucobacter soli]